VLYFKTNPIRAASKNKTGMHFDVVHPNAGAVNAP